MFLLKLHFVLQCVGSLLLFCPLLIHIFPSLHVCPFSLCCHPLLFTARYFFPRQLLIPHFWTPRQQVEFRALYHSLRARHHGPVLKGLENTSRQVKDRQLQNRLMDLCAKVSSVPVLPAMNWTLLFQICLNIITEHKLMDSLFIR